MGRAILEEVGCVKPEMTLDWPDKEISNCEFMDGRLEKRFRILIEKLWNGIGEPIPLACQDWANTKAAYRFFANPRINEAAILEGHFHYA